jgi:aspartate/tyrosine/aromatic aminotransferase
MFNEIKPAPRDAILGLAEEFKQDPNPAKINLTVGVYKDAQGKTPILATVKQAEERILRDESSKGYLGIDGLPEFGAAIQRLMFGDEHEIVISGRAVTAQTPGGTAALRVAADFIKKLFPQSRVWLSEPTWANHPAIFTAAGVEIQTYPYFDAANNGLDFAGMTAKLETAAPGDVVLLHGCCHNPTGVDPSPEQWTALADLARRKKLLPLLDFAYQGFAEGLREDAAALLALCSPGTESLVCSSYSKNFGLYNERVGGLTLVAATDDAATAALSQIKTCIRTNYSNPPAHGGSIVTTILNDAKLRSQWEEEVAGMRRRINDMRRLFVQTLADCGVKRDCSFIAHQRGMFSFSGLTPEQVDALREKYAIYAVRSGRINVAGMTETNLPVLCRAIAEVI